MFNLIKHKLFSPKRVFGDIVAGLAGSLLGLVVNGGYSILLARSLRPETLGGYSSLSGIVSAVSLAFLAVQLSTSHEIATLQVPKTLRQESLNLGRHIFYVGLFSAIVWTFVSLFLASPLKLTFWETASIAPSFVIIAVLSVELGKIHGSGRIRVWTAISQSGLVLKLLTVASVMAFSRTLISINLALAVSLLLTLGISSLTTREIDTPALRLNGKQLGTSFTGLGSYALLANLDVVAARILLGASESGQYAIIALFYKTYAGIFGVIGVVLFPRLAATRSQADSINARVRWAILGAAAAALFCSYIAARMSGHFLVPVFGSAYEPVRTQLLLASFVAVPWTGVYVAVFCRLVEKTWRLSTLLLGSTVIGVALLLVFAGDTRTLLLCCGGVGVLVLLSLIIVPTH